jgi:hypothetical protein
MALAFLSFVMIIYYVQCFHTGSVLPLMTDFGEEDCTVPFSSMLLADIISTIVKINIIMNHILKIPDNY